MNMTFDFGDGPVAAKPHPNGGGWVADTATVSDTTYVGPNACVFGNASIYGDARVFDNARVSGTTHVSDNAQVADNARVYGNAQVAGNARVYGDSRVSGNAVVIITPPKVSRSDGYDFIVAVDTDGINRVIAGCRYFTFEEARTFWIKTRGGTPLGEETTDILDYLEVRAKKLYQQNGD